MIQMLFLNVYIEKEIERQIDCGSKTYEEKNLDNRINVAVNMAACRLPAAS
jgi:hypothetical protein